MRRGIFNYIGMTIVASGLAMNAYAVAPGFYIGVATGPATNGGSDMQAQIQDSAATTIASPRASQWGSRLFIGNKINQWAGFELGLNYFTGISFDSKDVPLCSSAQVRERSFDLLAKGELPLYSFSVFGKLGAALVYETTSGSLRPTGTTECGKTNYLTKVRPTFGIGAGYDFNQNWVIDISAMRTLVGGAVSYVDFYGVSLSYHFVDVYCGQFLC